MNSYLCISELIDFQVKLVSKHLRVCIIRWKRRAYPISLSFSFRLKAEKFIHFG